MSESGGVGVADAVGHDHKRTRRQRRAHRVRFGQTGCGIGAHDPQRLAAGNLIGNDERAGGTGVEQAVGVEAYTGPGALINSGFLNGLEVDAGKAEAIARIEQWCRERLYRWCRTA
ncbi:hypothetical protein WCLP8_4060002 [uncultured Gammaproteobacteria bacterium]